MKLGDKVEWESQANGSTTLKVGFVLQVVPARQKPDIPAKGLVFDNEDGFRAEFTWPRDLAAGFRRNHESYLICVPQGQKAKQRLYWPRVKHLRLCK